MAFEPSVDLHFERKLAPSNNATEVWTMSDEKKVLAVNEAFYAAFATRDMGAMEGLWARRTPVACIHPGWRPLRGRADVMGSWYAILTGPASPAIRCSDATAQVLGDVACVVCAENIPGSRLVATNLFVREDEHWKLVHHHAGAVVTRPDEDDEPPEGMVH